MCWRSWKGPGASGLRSVAGVLHEATNLSAGKRVGDSYHIQTANCRHSQFRSFLRPFHGVAKKDVDSYLRLLQLVELPG